MNDSTFAAALDDIVEVFMFEQWLRYYYAKDRDEGLRLEIPAEDMKRIYEKYAHLAPLADMENNTAIDYAKSQAAVCSFIGARYDGSKYQPGVVTGVLDSKTFKVEMYVFGMWMKRHQPYLDAERMDFSDWREMYAGWNGMEQVKEYRMKLMAGGGDPNKPATNAVN